MFDRRVDGFWLHFGSHLEAFWGPFFGSVGSLRASVRAKRCQAGTKGVQVEPQMLQNGFPELQQGPEGSPKCPKLAPKLAKRLEIEAKWTRLGPERLQKPMIFQVGDSSHASKLLLKIAAYIHEHTHTHIHTQQRAHMRSHTVQHKQVDP